MPESRELVVDAKTPLDAYLDAVEAQDDETRRVALGRHAQQMEQRVRELSQKSYWEQFENSPEFAVLFVPGDQFLSAALAERPDYRLRAQAEHHHRDAVDVDGAAQGRRLWLAPGARRGECARRSASSARNCTSASRRSWATCRRCRARWAARSTRSTPPWLDRAQRAAAGAQVHRARRHQRDAACRRPGRIARAHSPRAPSPKPTSRRRRPDHALRPGTAPCQTISIRVGTQPAPMNCAAA